MCTVHASQGVQYHISSKSSASWSGPQKHPRQDLTTSPVGQRGDLSWSPWLPRSTEGSVVHHNSSHPEPVGKMPERQTLTCWAAKRAGSQKGSLLYVTSPGTQKWAASCGKENWSFLESLFAQRLCKWLQTVQIETFILVRDLSDWLNGFFWVLGPLN